jgi:Transmembrane domain of unknown function (DUF3566)
LDRRTDQSGGPGGTSRTAVTSRGLADDELGDLTLEVAPEAEVEDTDSAASSSAKASGSSVRKPAVRKASTNGTGRATASTRAKAAAATTEDSVSADTPTQEIAVESFASSAVATEETAAIDAALEDAARTDASVMESAVPAMPSDEIWTQHVVKPASKPSGMDDWAPVEASQRPSGNVYDVTNVYSAPPMPSEPYTTPAPATVAPSFTPSARSSPMPSVPHEAPPRPAGSVPPTQAFPRPTGAARPAPAPKAKPKPKASVRRSAGRQAHLTISRVEPWSVMKFSFAVSVVAFVILFVAVAVLYGVLSALGVFGSLQHLVTNVTSSQNQAGYNANKWFSASRILSYTVLLGGINVVLITALSTIGAVIYNLTSRLIGGVEVTLKETD